MMTLILLLILIQLSDSYCAELYEKMQSLYLKDLIMEPYSDYETLYRENMELKNKMSLLNES